MLIDAKIKYQEEYLPTPRHRISRIREVEELVSVELREMKKEEAPVAMVVSDYKSFLDENGKERYELCDTPFLAIDDQLYSEKRDMRGALDEGPYSLDLFMKDLERAGNCYFVWNDKDRDAVLNSLNKFVSSHVLIDGVVYEERGEPRYNIVTFGLGNNHGGTGLFVSCHYNENISKDNYFNALQRDDAIAYANKVAKTRGDTDYIGKFGFKNIKVLMPEMVRCEPNLMYVKEVASLDERIGSAEAVRGDAADAKKGVVERECLEDR